MDDAAHNPATIPAPGSYHWTPKLQREFLKAFATNGSVKISAAKVCMSPSAVYQLKQRPEGAAFRLGCAAATLIARGRLVDELLDRAIWGYEETSTIMREEGRSFVKRQRLDPRLGLAMLARLDKMVETRAREGEEMLAQIIAGDWPGFLSLFDATEVLAPDGAGPESTDAEGDQKSGMAAALALWLAARDNRANPLATLWRGTAIANEVAQFSADSDAEPERADEEPTPEEQAAQMTIWHDEESGEWRTDFPPPDDYVGIEEGVFGDEHYERTLDAEEEEAWNAAHTEAVEPLRRAGEAARRAFFALPDPANDPEAEGGKVRKSASG
ncbi:hypothetical protein SKP52_12200 [Sphingopyxis fribergensis]|uniref:Uncharacterized protein n=1 Tax=Sphingopyxis fribergensis TaxID=1515612 RepID=A0A0A7PH62_9SPHN|nr:hypothetical protein [Sphingopyxis fribergensis]AJA09335.1 hypothetical protein SKP52_12200 [Sphingopyxis fribergensis]